MRLCEDLIKISQCDRHYYYLGGGIALNYHPIKFSDNCKTQCCNKSKTINWRLRTSPSVKMGLHSKINENIFYVKFERKLQGN